MINSCVAKICLAVVMLASVLSDPAFAEERQLHGTQMYGPKDAVEQARRAADGILLIVNGFPNAVQSGDATAIGRLAASVYAPDAVVFQSQPFMEAHDLGGDGFIKTLTFLHETLGRGESYLRPVQVCAIYAFYPEEADDEVHFVMTTEAQVPQFGQVLNTVMVKTRQSAGGHRIVYHEYIAEPAGGQDCTGSQAAEVDQEWRAKVQWSQITQQFPPG